MLARWQAKHPIHEVASMENKLQTWFVPFVSFSKVGHNLNDILQQRGMVKAIGIKPSSPSEARPSPIAEL